jgi:S-DNA-T family DNA segregation ATPase FtsK/SpoIIIE
MVNATVDSRAQFFTRTWSGVSLVWRLPAVARVRGGVMAMAGGALVLALASYHAADPSWNVSSSEPVHNLLGAPGAAIADMAMQSLGLSSWILALVLLTAGLAKAGARDLQSVGPMVRWRTLLALLGVILLASALSGPAAPRAWPLAAGLGGFWGDTILHGLVGLSRAAHLPGGGIVIPSLFAIASILLLGRAAGIGLKDLSIAGEWLAAGGTHAVGLAQDHLQRRSSGEASPAQQAERPARAPRRTEPESVSDMDRPAPDIAGRAEPPVAFRPLDDAENHDVPPFDLAPKPVTEASSGPAVSGIKSPKLSAREQRENQAAFDFAHTGGFRLPELAMLSKAKPRMSSVDEQALRQNAHLLETVLSEFGVKGQIDQIRPGPVVTLYELVPAPGVKHSRVVALSDDIARSMSARACRVAVVQGRNAIGIELPNARRDTVYLRDLLASADYEKSTASLPMALGESIGGEPYVADLARMPHLLIAGTTGSGKSVGVNAMILSVLYRLTPDQCRFIMIDPKMLELSVYDGIPHLLAPVVTDPKKAIVALKWTVREMEDRYRRMSKIGVRNIGGFNEKANEALSKGEHFERTVQTGFDDAGRPVYETETVRPEPMPYLVVVIDEVADLMMVAGKDIEGAVQRLAQMARAAGIHLIMATQRPSVDVITGTIKANFPTRISFQVTSKIDARTILGEQGAEQLLGQGDMLYMAGGGRVTRLHGPFVSDAEVEAVANFLRQQGEPSYVDDVTADDDEGDGEGGDYGADGGGSGNDLYDQAVAVVTRDRKASTSYIQRRLQIGYNRAASLIERMEKEGVVSAANHAGKRDILAGPPPPP